MLCRKCKKDIPEGSLYCNLCGAKQTVATPKPKTRTRPNGTGTVYKRGKTWTAMYIVGWNPMPDGRFLAEKRTKGGFATKREAFESLPMLKAQSNRNPDANITFAQLYERWYEQHADRVVPSTMGCYKAAYNYYDDIYHLKFAYIGVDDLQYCVDACPRGKRTKENMKALGTLLFKYAAGRRIVDENNLASYIYVGKGGKSTRPAFPAKVLQEIWSSVGKVPYADYIVCMCYLGFRPNEMLSLTKAAFCEEDGVNYLIGGSKTEAGTDRKVTISPKIMPIIRRRLEDKSSIYLFPKTDGSLMRDEYFRESCFYPALDRIGIQPIPKTGERAFYVPYSCRHTFANLMKNVSGSDTDKAALMGHTNISMTKRYQSEELDKLFEITNAL